MTEYTLPPLVPEAEAKYAETRQQLVAEGAATSLDNMINRMDSMQAAA